MLKSCLSLAAQNPILLDKDHYLTRLIVTDAHVRVIHNGVKETLTELRSEYWLVKGRQLVRKLIHSCTVCKKEEGKPCRGYPHLLYQNIAFSHLDRSKHSDNGKTFKSASKIIREVLESSEAKRYFTQLHVEWIPYFLD